MKPTVVVIVYCPYADLVPTATLTLKTVRIGFPTSRVIVKYNGSISYQNVGNTGGYEVVFLPFPLSHAELIQQTIESHNFLFGPLIILDGDLVFWKSCEDWITTDDIRGRYIPGHQSPYTKCWAAPRIHSSFLWINRWDTARLPINPNLYYAPTLLWQPQVIYHSNNKPVFYDTGAMLWNTNITQNGFTDTMLDCYDHIFCGSSLDVAKQYLSPADAVQLSNIHRDAVHAPEKLRGLWRAQQKYYESLQ